MFLDLYPFDIGYIKKTQNLIYSTCDCVKDILIIVYRYIILYVIKEDLIRKTGSQLIISTFYLII